MQNFKAAYINELYKLSKKKKITVAAILYALAVVIACIIVLTVNGFMGIRVANADFPTIVLNVLSYTLIPLFSSFVAIDMISGEFADNTIKFTLTRPASRFKIYLAKTASCASFILASLIYIMFLSVIGGLLTGSSNINLPAVFLSYIAAFLPIFVFSQLVMFISCMFKSTGVAFMLSVILFLTLNVLGLFYGHIQSFFVTSFFSWYTLFLGSYINFSKIFRVLLILIGCGIMLFTGGYYLFDRKDV